MPSRRGSGKQWQVACHYQFRTRTWYWTSYTNLFNIFSHLVLSVTLYFLHIKNEDIKDIRDHPGVSSCKKWPQGNASLSV